MTKDSFHQHDVINSAAVCLQTATNPSEGGHIHALGNPTDDISREVTSTQAKATTNIKERAKIIDKNTQLSALYRRQLKLRIQEDWK